jgi:transposase
MVRQHRAGCPEDDRGLIPASQSGDSLHLKAAVILLSGNADSEGCMPRPGIEIATTHTAAQLRAEARSCGCSQAACRMTAIANALELPSRTQAAKLANLSVQALRDAVLRYNAEGLAGLYNRPSPGRKPKLNSERKAELKDLILKGPDIEVEGISSYTLQDLTEITKKKWGISYHPASMSRVVRKMNMSRQKSRPYNPKQDPASVEAFKKSPGNTQDGCGYI